MNIEFVSDEVWREICQKERYRFQACGSYSGFSSRISPPAWSRLVSDTQKP